MSNTIIIALIIFLTLSVLGNFQLMRMLAKNASKEKETNKSLQNANLERQSCKQEISFLKKNLEDKETQILEIKNENLTKLKEMGEEYSKRLNALKQEQKETLFQQKQDYEHLIKKLENSAEASFSNIAQQILEQKSKNLNETSTQHLSHILSPFKTELAGFKDIISKSSAQSTEQIASLKTQITLMQEQEKKLMLTAENLTKALTTENKTQGNWGEMILRQILEASGLQEGYHFTEQGKGLGLQNDEGHRQQPDFIINLPNNKHIVLDSKVSLTAYERFCTSNQKEDLEAFIRSIKTHIKQLSAKEYQKNLNSPDFTIMFLPIEGAYFLAVQSDRTLWEEAWSKKIAICCPSNLFPMLKTVANLWENDAINKNAQEIAKRAVSIYKKFNGFLANFETIGKNLEDAQTVYQKAHGQFISGGGSLQSQFEKMQSLTKKHGIEVLENELIEG